MTAPADHDTGVDFSADDLRVAQYVKNEIGDLQAVGGVFQTRFIGDGNK